MASIEHAWITQTNKAFLIKTLKQTTYRQMDKSRIFI